MKLKALVLLALLSTLIACEQKEEMQTETATATTGLTTDADRFSYGLGMVIGERVLKQYESVDYDLLIEGMKAQHQSQATLITMEDAGAVLAAHAQQQLETQTEANKMKGADYLAENAKKEGVSVTESGLQYSVITQGDGAKPGATDQVTDSIAQSPNSILGRSRPRSACHDMPWAARPMCRFPLPVAEHIPASKLFAVPSSGRFGSFSGVPVRRRRSAHGNEPSRHQLAETGQQGHGQCLPPAGPFD